MSIAVLMTLGLSACTTAKLEARLEANPQCKDVMNTKTGALMPCPGSDRAFYVAAGLEAPRPAKVKAADTATPSSLSGANSAAVTSPAKQALSDCKPQIHKKTGGILPCPSVD